VKAKASFLPAAAKVIYSNPLQLMHNTSTLGLESHTDYRTPTLLLSNGLGILQFRDAIHNPRLHHHINHFFMQAPRSMSTLNASGNGKKMSRNGISVMVSIIHLPPPPPSKFILSMNLPPTCRLNFIFFKFSFFFRARLPLRRLSSPLYSRSTRPSLHHQTVSNLAWPWWCRLYLSPCLWPRRPSLAASRSLSPRSSGFT